MDSTGEIVCRRDDGFDIYCKKDGVDYWRLVRACIAENISQKELMREPYAEHRIRIERDGVDADLLAMAFINPKRLVFRMDVEGRRYVIKRAFMGSPGFKRLLPGVVGLTYFTRIMKLVNAAVRAGCDATQDCYLVAERWIAPFRLEVWTVMQYLEGRQLLGEDSIDPYREALERTVGELLRHGLTMDDLTLGNFLVDGARVRAIDISCRPFARLQKVKMALKMNARYGLSLPIEGVVDRAIRALLLARYRLRGGIE